MIKQLKVTTTPLTEKLANEFATMKASPGERGLTTARRAFLTAKVVNGEFHSPTWAFAWLRGEKYRVDGQGSSIVLSESNGHFPKNLDAVVYEFSCDSDIDLADLFRRWNNPESVRSKGDAVAAHAKTEPLLVDLPKTAISKAVDGIAEYERLNHDTRMSHDDRARLTHTEQSFIAWFAGYYADKAFCVASAAAAFFATFKRDTKAADEFWSLVRSEKHESPHHPTRAISKWLREVRASNMPGLQVKRRYVGKQIYESCIHAWNAYRDGRELKLIRTYSNSKAGEIVKAK